MNYYGSNDINKLHKIVAFAINTDADVVCLNDTHANTSTSLYLKQLFKDELYAKTKQQWIVLINPAGPENGEYHERFGGQLILINERYNRKICNVYREESNLGCLTGITLNVNKHPVLILVAYWPFHNPSVGNKGLEAKLSTWLDDKGIRSSPLEYLKDQIANQIISHIHKTNRLASYYLLGDLNSVFYPRENGGSHSPLSEWADSAGLVDKIGAHAHFIKKDFKTYWQGETPISRIDHILSNDGRCTLTSYGCSNSPIWTGYSDHRPLWGKYFLPELPKKRK